MKSIITLVLLSSISACFADQNLHLEIYSPVKTVRLGDSLKMKLKIIGSEVHEIVEDQEGVVPLKFNMDGALVHEFEFEPQREGLFELGPVNISINGQELVSNIITINVLPQWDGEFGTFFRVDTNSINFGEQVEFVVETWTTNREDRYTYYLDTSNSNHKENGKRGGTYVNDGNRVYYSMNSWLITPDKTGTFIISESLFKNIESERIYPNISISVSPSKVEK